MKSSELREKYIAFFESKGCKRWPSSSLIPDDPSMLLTSAGMVQFKPYFLQLKQIEKPYIGTVSVQKCVRTTDIDIIGTTGRHLSFFEMLGNFSFGEYFKKEMCAWAYEFSTEVLGFDPQRLYFSVYLDDDETVAIWQSLGVSKDHIVRLGAEDNFWSAGPTGPCGPCSELYYDHGEAFGCGKPDCQPGCDCDRFVEFWNCVFTQYDRQEDGELIPLPKKNIDTGMGLERTAAILQGVSSNYETDILRDLIALGEKLSGQRYGQGAKSDLSLRILADHARSVTFMIADGILPSNEKRGFVLRRLIRHAVRHGLLLNIDAPFMSHYVQSVISEMGAAYPELVENQALIERIVTGEEERFGQTLRLGQNYLDEHISELKAAALDAALNSNGELAAGAVASFGDTRVQNTSAASSKPMLSGATAFELHDTYGFPIELTTEIAAEQDVEVDRSAFEQLMEDQRNRARAAATDDAWSSVGSVFANVASAGKSSEFVGYEHSQSFSKIVAIVVQDEDDRPIQLDTIKCGQRAQIVLDKTPFYGEKGGQVGDHGWLLPLKSACDSAPFDSVKNTESLFDVQDCKIREGIITAHVGIANADLSVGDEVLAAIDSKRRQNIERNHTATHLLHQALREVLGDHVKQAGSLVAAKRLRFDFTHFEALSHRQLSEVETRVNQLIAADLPVRFYETSLEQARQSGVTALFGEKYAEVVRVLEIDDVSRELCGGTHVQRTGQIGLIKILGESSVAASMRRIEAVTSLEALAYTERVESELRSCAEVLRCAPFEVHEKLAIMQKRIAEQNVALKQKSSAGATGVIEKLVAQAIDLGYKLVIARIDDLDALGMRENADMIRERLAKESKAAAVVLGTVSASGAPLLLAAANQEACTLGFDASAVIRHIALAIQGGGGGKPTMAQAGGKNADGLDEALAMARKLLVESK